MRLFKPFPTFYDFIGPFPFHLRSCEHQVSHHSHSLGLTLAAKLPSQERFNYCNLGSSKRMQAPSMAKRPWCMRCTHSRRNYVMFLLEPVHSMAQFNIQSHLYFHISVHHGSCTELVTWYHHHPYMIFSYLHTILIRSWIIPNTSHLSEYHWVSVTPSHSCCWGLFLNWLPGNVKIGTWCCAKLGKSCASRTCHKVSKCQKCVKHLETMLNHTSWNILPLNFVKWFTNLIVTTNHYAFITYIRGITCSPIVKVCVARLAGPSETPQDSTNSWSRFAKEFGSRLNWQTGKYMTSQTGVVFWVMLIQCCIMSWNGMWWNVNMLCPCRAWCLSNSKASENMLKSVGIYWIYWNTEYNIM